MGKIKIKKVVNVFGWIGSGIGALLVIAWTGFFVWEHFHEARMTREVERALAARESAEVASGETPQETFSFFLDALRDNDLDLAATYFVPEFRRGWQITLQRIKEAKLLDGMITDLENREADSPLTEEYFRETNGQWKLVAL